MTFLDININKKVTIHSTSKSFRWLETKSFHTRFKFSTIIVNFQDHKFEYNIVVHQVQGQVYGHTLNSIRHNVTSTCALKNINCKIHWQGTYMYTHPYVHEHSSYKTISLFYLRSC